MVSDPLKLGYSGGPGTFGNCSGYTFEQGGLSGMYGSTHSTGGFQTKSMRRVTKSWNRAATQ